MGAPSDTKTGTAAGKRTWRRLLLDGSYQITYALPLVLIAAVVIAGLGYLAMDKVESATKIGLNQISHTGAAYLADAGEAEAVLLERQRTIQYGIVIGGLLLCAGLFLFGLRITHRVAGPLYRVRKQLEAISSGRFGMPEPLRRKDELTVFYDRFGRACRTLRDRQSADVEVMKRAMEHCSGEAAEKLRERIEIKEQGLG